MVTARTITGLFDALDTFHRAIRAVTVMLTEDSSADLAGQVRVGALSGAAGGVPEGLGAPAHRVRAPSGGPPGIPGRAAPARSRRPGASAFLSRSRTLTTGATLAQGPDVDLSVALPSAVSPMVTRCVSSGLMAAG